MRTRTAVAVALLATGTALGPASAWRDALGDPPPPVDKPGEKPGETAPDKPPGKPPEKPDDKPDEVATYFTKGPIPKLKIGLAPEEYQKLEKTPRQYVHASLSEGGKVVFQDVGVHLKGFYGSWRTIDQKPGFSVKVDKWVKGQVFHGLVKFNLNNGAQDATFFDEFVGSEVFRAAGMAATLAAHARVWINERDVGMYVLKEGWDKRFLKRNFADPDGNLYDGGGATDIDTPLSKDSSSGPGKKKADKGAKKPEEPKEPGEEEGADEGDDGDDRSDLQALLAACRETDPAKSRAAISAALDVDKFLTFMALERMLCHVDGYCMNRNNYRLYFPKNGKGVFLPHGMDWLLADAQVPLFEDPASIVAVAVWRDAEWQAAYRKRIAELLPIFLHPEKLFRRIDDENRRASSGLAGAPNGPQAGTIKARISARAKNVADQLASPAPKPLDLDKGASFRVQNWRPVPEAGGPKLLQNAYAGDRVLRIEAGKAGPSVGSWQTKLLLAAGKYRFEAAVLVDGVVATDGAPKGGAGLRLPGVADPPHVDGSGTWKTLKAEFALDAPRKVDLAIELRAVKGVAMFRLGSLRIVRVE